MTVGERIRAARTACILTQKELGEKAHIAEPTIRSYELGRLNPKITTIQKIANAMLVPYALLTGEQPFPDPFLENSVYLNAVLEKIDAAKKTNYCSTVSFVARINAIEIQLAYITIRSAYNIDIVFKSYMNPDLYIERTPPVWWEDKINIAMTSMNKKGQQKAVENVQDLAKIPEYQKGEPQA